MDQATKEFWQAFSKKSASVLGKVFAVAVASFFGGMLALSLLMTSLPFLEQYGAIVTAIVCGGLGGGFTLALIGGKRYGLTFPGRVGVENDKIDPGFYGDLFVGLMSAFLGVGIAVRSMETRIFPKPGENNIVELWFMDFAFAYICGFLGLKFIKSISNKFLNENEINQRLEQVEKKEAVAEYLLAQEAVDIGQLDEAERLYRRVLATPGYEVLALIGLGRVYRRRDRFGEAIAWLDRAIGVRDNEIESSRLAVVYWNRACYRLLASESVGDRRQAIDDLRISVGIQPSFKLDLLKDPDLEVVRNDPDVLELSKT